MKLCVMVTPHSSLPRDVGWLDGSMVPSMPNFPAWSTEPTRLSAHFPLVLPTFKLATDNHPTPRFVGLSYSLVHKLVPTVHCSPVLADLTWAARWARESGATGEEGMGGGEMV